MSWFSRKSKRRSKSRIVKKSGYINRERFLYLVKKTGLIGFFVIALLWGVSWFFMSDLADASKNWTYQKFLTTTQNVGLKLENLNVEGRYFADPNEILSAVGLQKGDPIFSFDEKKTKESLADIEWVSEVYVKRILPNTIYVLLEEAVPMALYKEGEDLFLIDTNGQKITQKNLVLFQDLIIVTGKKSRDQAAYIVKNLKAINEIFLLVETAQYVSERRWDLYLQNGIQIKLPENDIALALSTLFSMQNDDKIFEKNISIVDMRDLSRINVRTKNGSQFEASKEQNSANGDLI